MPTLSIDSLTLETSWPDSQGPWPAVSNEGNRTLNPADSYSPSQQSVRAGWSVPFVLADDTAIFVN